ncbi:apolipoprotein D-like [Mizuhopecten yessoensis]|uniref:Apolipoprotein D n=1 Tax=Mizuhopecten yessoensis TaxID=6573 RepID=A0A210PTS9_MIZYE|nr:apolipoprotein D-like [Mizuhopecten yessoensis]OWF39856.1 Apolipoprotein D [Mizuhopecten yessoensis]
MRLSHFLVVIALVADTSLAQVFGKGKCPTVTVQKSFDLQKYLGDWYEIFRFYAGFEDNTKCTVANYQLKDNGHIRVDNKGISLKDESKVIEAVGDGYSPDEAEPAKLQVKFAEGIPYGDYWILDTDYTNYTLIYSCKDVLGLTHVEFCWILSRERTLASETKDRLYQKLSDFGVKTENFLTTDQKDCK